MPPPRMIYVPLPRKPLIMPHIQPWALLRTFTYTKLKHVNMLHPLRKMWYKPWTKPHLTPGYPQERRNRANHCSCINWAQGSFPRVVIFTTVEQWPVNRTVDNHLWPLKQLVTEPAMSSMCHNMLSSPLRLGLTACMDLILPMGRPARLLAWSTSASRITAYSLSTTVKLQRKVQKPRPANDIQGTYSIHRPTLALKENRERL